MFLVGAIIGLLCSPIVILLSVMLYRFYRVESFNPACSWGGYLFYVFVCMVYLASGGYPATAFVGDILGSAFAIFGAGAVFFKRA